MNRSSLFAIVCLTSLLGYACLQKTGARLPDSPKVLSPTAASPSTCTVSVSEGKEQPVKTTKLRLPGLHPRFLGPWLLSSQHFFSKKISLPPNTSQRSRQQNHCFPAAEDLS